MSRSRPHTSQPRSRHQRMLRHRFLPKLNKLGRDLQMMLRPPVQQARSRRQSHVATSWTTKPMSRHQIHVATSHTVAHVATPFLPTVGFPGRDLPYCCPCRDLKNDVATSTQLSPISATSRRHFSMSRPLLLLPLKMMSRHQFLWPKFQVVHPETYCNPARSRNHFLVATSRPTKPGRDLKSMSRPQQVLTHNNFFFFHPVAFLLATPLMQ